MLRIPHCLDNRLTDGGKILIRTELSSNQYLRSVINIMRKSQFSGLTMGEIMSDRKGLMWSCPGFDHRTMYRLLLTRPQNFLTWEQGRYKWPFPHWNENSPVYCEHLAAAATDSCWIPKSTWPPSRLALLCQQQPGPLRRNAAQGPNSNGGKNFTTSLHTLPEYSSTFPDTR
jgi:hypothetical protein